MGILNAETISNSVIWEQSDHKSTAQEVEGIDNNVTTPLTRLGGNITREHHNKAVSGEYIILKPRHKPEGYGNCGVSTALAHLGWCLMASSS